MHGTEALTVAPGPAPRPELRSTALFFDVDGTLLELQRRPDDVLADAPLRDMIVRLQSMNSGAVALVSGRAIRDLDRIFAPLILPAAGLHGAELRFPDGSRVGSASALMDHARPDVGRFVAEHAGLMLEDKGATLAVHFRERPDLAADVLRFMTRFGPGDEIAVQEGKFVVELKPVLFDKGTAIATMLEHAPFLGRTPVFYGDDLTDEAGFGYVNKVGGLSVRIGDRDIPTEARLNLPNPAALREHLMELTRASSGEHGPS
ncbi:MAG: trehalose-phosphatase [Beijerinckiaceae bacterium]|jgi:trehalose 6-phosphate phosphatase|nr:trehalose-phosphatase [Beijerinckiaceae bacterium]MDO9439581.1 trehalose-phosphatase [Beijerinckiaceae bacterium]